MTGLLLPYGSVRNARLVAKVGGTAPAPAPSPTPSPGGEGKVHGMSAQALRIVRLARGDMLMPYGMPGKAALMNKTALSDPGKLAAVIENLQR